MRIKLLCYLLLFSTIIMSQSLVRKFDLQPGNQIYNLGSSAPIIQTSDGGYLLNYSYGYPDFHGGPIYSTLIKTNSNFLPIWKKDLLVSNGKKTFTFIDGSIILFENAQSYYSMSFNLEKLDSYGSTIWKKNEYEIGPNKITILDAYLKDNNDLRLAGVKEFNYGYYFGYSSSPVIMDFDLNGNYLQGFILSIPNVPYGVLESISNDSFGNYYVIIKNLTSRYIAKFDVSDTLIWCKKFNFNNHSFYNINSSIILNNGDLLIGGTYNNYNFNLSTLSIVKISSNGNIIWSKTTNDFLSSVNGIKELPSNEIVLTGTISENNVSRNLMIKIDESGNLIWSKKYSDSFTSSEMFLKSNNEWYFAGFSYSYTTLENYPFIFSTDNNGNADCNSELAPLTLTNNNAYLTNETLTTNVLTLLPPSTINSGTSDIQSYEDICPSLSNPIINQNDKVILFPNPSKGNIKVISENFIEKITINNILGEKIKEIYPNTLEFNFFIEVSGIYLIHIESNKEFKTFKLIIND